MARARNIKPGFFRNADLVELPMEARLLFIGLWTLADREGRLEDRPKQIKMEIFPADSVDCDALLMQLASTGMVARYEVDGKRYLQVVNFTKHQNPHRDEKASTVPDQEGNLATPAPAPKKHGANTVQAPGEDDARTVAIGLNPDPGFLIPDSPTEAKASLSAGKPSDPGQAGPEHPEKPESPDEPQDALPHCPHGDLLDLFAEQLPTLPRPKRELWSGAREAALKARWRWVLTAKKRDGTRYATSREEALSWFKRFFAFVAESDFLTGRDGKWTACDLGWLCNETNFAKVVQGNYTNKEAA